MRFRFIKYSKIYFIISGFLAIASVASILIFGINWGIDFVGGSILKVTYVEQKPDTQELSKNLSDLGLNNFSIRLSGERGVVIKMPEAPQEVKDKVSAMLYSSDEIEKDSISYEAVSPVVGEESKAKSIRAVMLSIVAIVLYVAFAFRKISRPVKSWQYGIATVIALVHDVFIPVGIFALLGHFWGVEFSIPILTALLTILGYSVNDTVVVFDRIRENLIKNPGEPFNDVVNDSLNQTLVRSLSTGFATLVVLLAIFLFGDQSLTYFSFALIVGIVFGSYSSIFLASTLIAQIYNFQRRAR